MAEYLIDGVKLEELEPISTITEDSIFLVGINKTCRIINLRNLRSAFRYTSGITDKANVFYDAAYIDQVVNDINKATDQINQDITQLDNKVTQEIQNLNQRFEQLSTSLTDKVNNMINEAIDNINKKMEQLTAQINEKLQEFEDMKDSIVLKSTKINTVLPYGSWVEGDELPFTITIQVNGVTATNNVEIVLPGSANPDQVDAWCSAAVVHGTQAENSVTLKGYGTVPEIDIPIEVIIRKDI